jgi:acyl-coenzyme A synthetase/AMP-(fatty) acid ligase
LEAPVQLIKQIIFQAREREDEPAATTLAQTISYRSVVNAISAAVDRLEQLGIGKDALVKIEVADPVHHLCLVIGLSLLGIPCASVARGVGLGDAGPEATLLLTDLAAPSLVARRVVHIDAGWFNFDPRMAPNYLRLLNLRGFENPSDVCRYIFSSGTTGVAKCIGMTLGDMETRLLTNTLLFAGRHALRAPVLNLMGMSTISGNLTAVRALATGSMICLPRGIAPALEMIRLFNVEYLQGSVGQITALADLLRDRQPLTSIRTIYMTGAKISARSVADIQTRIGGDMYCAYAATETGVMAVATGTSLQRADGSVGYVMPGVTIEAVDSNGNPVPPGTEGILRVRPRQAATYVESSGSRRSVLDANGWFYPGDVGRVGIDGLLVVTGRTADVINRGGVITAPDYIEEVFRQDARVADVAAVGVPNERGYEEIWVAVVSGTTLNIPSLMQQARALLRDKTPDRVFQVGAIPRNENAKVQRSVLREQLRAAARPSTGFRVTNA